MTKHYSHVSPNGKKLAQSIVDATLAIRQNTRGIKTRIDDDGTDYFGMIRMTDAPAVLVECAFIDNAIDIQIINTEAKRKVLGYAIADGVAKYLGVKLPSTSKPTTLSNPTTAAVKIEAPNLGDYLKEGDRNLAVYSYKQQLALLRRKASSLRVLIITRFSAQEQRPQQSRCRKPQALPLTSSPVRRQSVLAMCWRRSKFKNLIKINLSPDYHYYGDLGISYLFWPLRYSSIQITLPSAYLLK